MQAAPGDAAGHRAEPGGGSGAHVRTSLLRRLTDAALRKTTASSRADPEGEPERLAVEAGDVEAPHPFDQVGDGI